MSLEQLAARRAEFAAKGLCKACGDPVEPGKRHCAAHLEYFRDRLRRVRRERRYSKVCLRCGQRLAFKSGLCVQHYLDDREAREKLKQRHLASGKCRCGRIPIPGKKQCRLCRDQQCARDRRRR